MFKRKSIDAAVETIYDAFYEALADEQDITLLQTDFCKAYDYVNKKKKIEGSKYNCLNFLSFVIVCILVAGCHRKYYGNLFTQCKGRRGISCQKCLVRTSR